MKEKLEEWFCVLNHLGHHYRPTPRQIAYLETEGVETKEVSCLFCGKEKLLTPPSTRQ